MEKNKRILGLDLGTNSVGWAVVELNENGNFSKKIQLGSRILPMSQDILAGFNKGVKQSQTAERTLMRGSRRLTERRLLRRERLHRVLHLLDFLPKHYDESIGWDRNDYKTFGKFKQDLEPKLAWKKNEDGKMEFLFMSSFQEMLDEFYQRYPHLADGRLKIPMDWTLYYLRKKALTHPLTKHELAWVLMSFNQKRGYNQLRGEEADEDITKPQEYMELKIISVTEVEQRANNKILYRIEFENGWTWDKESKTPLQVWEGKVKEFIVTTYYEKDGITLQKTKEGEVKRSFRMPDVDDWTLNKKRTEHLLDDSGRTLGSFIYHKLLENPAIKLRGGFVNVVDRKYYKQELQAILKAQQAFHTELTNTQLLAECAEELYPSNKAHQENLKQKDWVYLLVEDVILYQRPLKSKKSTIAECPYEKRGYVDKSTGEIKSVGIKCIAKSNPIFQEFRLWQFVHNLRLVDTQTNEEITSNYLPTEDDYAKLFDYLNTRKEIKQSTLLKDHFGIKPSKINNEQVWPVRWNYINDDKKTYPCNETRHALLTALKKAELPEDFLTREMEYRLWHLLYSVTNKEEAQSALRKIKDDDNFVEAFLKVKAFPKDYGAYSEKAIKKMLPLMRMGHHWSADFPDNVACQIQQIIDKTADKNTLDRLFKEDEEWRSIQDFKGLPLWKVCYILYGKHSEGSDIRYWQSPDDLDSYINGFKQHSLRNPIVEQCVLETLRTVLAIWREVGDIDEIHIELAREMQQTAEQRSNRTKEIIRNESTNLRIRKMLMEFKNDAQIADVRPYSPMQQELLRIYEEGALQHAINKNKLDDDVKKISEKAEPTSAEIQKYKLWLDQKYISPYTGKPISLSKLFTTAYQIEHVIPQSRYFDNSLSNKVICESEVNRLKSNRLGLEFIKQEAGKKLYCAGVGEVTILTENAYRELIDSTYNGHSKKKEKLLLEEIPTEFSQRQINDTRYISKMVMGVLSNIVRQQGEMEAKSKFVLSTTGDVTFTLKNDWGLNDVWNSIVTPRFQRMNKLTNTNDYGFFDNKDGKRVFQTDVPLEHRKGFKKKRIDHRHHALDALVIACANANIVNYLSNKAGEKEQSREDLRKLLCDKNRIIRKPWDTFTQDAHEALKNLVVSFKKNVRVLTKTTHSSETYNAQGKKVMKPQQGILWSIRKPLHKDTFYGQVNLQQRQTVALKKALECPQSICDKALRDYLKPLIAKGFTASMLLAHFKDKGYRFQKQDIRKVDIWTFSNDDKVMVASRKPLDSTIKIDKITDTGIQKILRNYLEAKGRTPAEVFTPEGIDELNNNIERYNDGKPHKPIYKVRISDAMGMKFPVGTVGTKGQKFVEAESGTNLYFAIYEDAQGERSYETIPLNIVIERRKQGLQPVPETNEKGEKLKFYLSPNDLVYVPNEQERIEGCDKPNPDRIYKFVSGSSNRAWFIPHHVAVSIVDKEEFSAKNKMERSIDDEGIMIKSVCWKLIVNRLGRIIDIQK